MIQSFANQSASGTTGIAGDFGIPVPQSLVNPPPPGTSPMPRLNPFGFVVAGAGVASGAVQLEGSLDEVNWYSIGSPVTTGAPGVFPLPAASPPVPARYVRARISTVVVGGTVSAWVDAAP